MAEITTYSQDLGTTALTEIMDSQHQVFEHMYLHVCILYLPLIPFVFILCMITYPLNLIPKYLR